MTKKTKNKFKFPKWSIAVRNSLIVFGFLFASEILRSGIDCFNVENLFYNFGLALLWLMVELIKMYKVDISGIKERAKATPFLLP
jgi:hypothetical protein